MRGRRVCIGLVALMSVAPMAACGSDKNATSSSSSTSETRSPSSSARASSSTETASGSEAGEGGDDPILALSRDGLTFVSISGSTRPVEFGSSESTVNQALESTVGPQQDSGIGQVCDDGSARTFDTFRYGDGLQVYFRNDSFVGWVSTSRAFTTIDGIGVGSALSDLRAALGDVTLTEGSLGTEFSAGSLGGVLDGNSDSSKVTDLFNGEVCIIR